MQIDSHQHFWIYNRQRDHWITDEMQVIRRDFLPADLQPVLHPHQIDGCVAVQADQSEAETDFLVALAHEHPFIKGVVGWVNLTAPDLEARLRHFQSTPVIKGFRHILQAEPPGFMSNPAFVRGVQSLHKFQFTYDILVKEHQLEETGALVKLLPGQKLVIDHLGKPRMDADFSDWKKHITLLAEQEHVHCKLSGLVTEADWHHWKKDDFRPYLDTVLGAFGIRRVMYGSDWPVCLLAASYGEQLGLITDYIQTFSPSEKQAIMGENAIRFYNL